MHVNIIHNTFENQIEGRKRGDTVGLKALSIEQIINHISEAEVLLARGQTVGEICWRIGLSEQCYNRWRRGVSHRLISIEAPEFLD